MEQDQQVTDEPNKRRRVHFFPIDAGVDPRDCIIVYLVSRKEEMDGGDALRFDTFDFRNIFEKDGRIYGYQGLKISVWMNIISFHSFSEITFEGTYDCGKGITNLTFGLQILFGETLLDNIDDFIESFSRNSQYISDIISSGEILWQKSANGRSSGSEYVYEKAGSEIQIIRMGIVDAGGHLYSRLVPLILLLADGGTGLDLTDNGWELYLLIEKSLDQTANRQDRLLGFSAVYRFYHYPDCSRLRLSQILVLPPYRRKGYGRCLLEVLNDVAIKENIYDVTIEEPSEKLQHLRTCIDVLHLLGFDPGQSAVNATVSRLKQGKLSKKIHPPRLLPPLDVVEDVRKTFRINKRQFLQCWEILVYLGLYSSEQSVEDYFSVVSNRVRANILWKASDTSGKEVIDVRSNYDPKMSFVMFRSGASGKAVDVVDDEDQNKREQQIMQLIDQRLAEIKLIAGKVSQLGKRSTHIISPSPVNVPRNKKKLS